MIQYIKFGQNTSFGSRDSVQTSFSGQNLTFKVPVWPWKWGQGHKNLIISFACLSSGSVQVWSKSTNWFRRKRADKALINSFNPIDTIYKNWPESIILFKRWGADKLLFFWSKFDIQSAGVTLKMRLRSLKSNHFFPTSHLCFCASLVKIHQLVQETNI